MKFIDVYAQAVGRNSTFVFYGLEDGPVNIDGYTYKIYSGRDKSELKLTAKDIKTHYYKDNDIISESSNTVRYYKIELVLADTVICSSNVIPVNQQGGDLKAKKIARLYQLVMNKKSGSEALFYVRKKSGFRCPICYDKDLKASTISNCENCGGVGIMDGYYPSIPLKAQFSNITKRKDTSIPSSDEMPGSIIMADVPIATIKDVVYEIPRNRLWEVKNVEELSHNSNIYAQKITAVRLSNSSSIYEKVKADIDLSLLEARASEIDSAGVAV